MEIQCDLNADDDDDMMMLLVPAEYLGCVTIKPVFGVSNH